VSVGGELFPVSWDSRGDANRHVFQSASAQQASEDFTETAQVASQQVDAERSIVVSLSEDKETQDVVAREIENKNDCRAVTYFIRRVNEVSTLTTTVWSVAFVTPGQRFTASGNLGDAMQRRSITDLSGLDEKQVALIRRAAELLPRPGQTVDVPIQIALPTDGVVYEAELAHCSSCEPAREVTVQLTLQRAKADERKACFESELVELEVQGRDSFCNRGTFRHFDLPKP
jgi:thermitase